jgi:hypothetical protein
LASARRLLAARSGSYCETHDSFEQAPNAPIIGYGGTKLVTILSPQATALASVEPFVGALVAAHRAARTGVLEVEGEEAYAVVYLAEGIPVFAEEGTLGESLGRVLLREGQLSSAQYTRVLERMTSTPMGSEQLRFGEVAIALGFLTEEQLTLALREQVRLKVLRCVQWEAPVCGFRSAADEVAEVVHYPCPVGPVVLDGIRRFFDAERAERSWRLVANDCPGLRELLAAVSHRFGMQPRERELLGALDGLTPTRVLLLRADQNALRMAQLICALGISDEIVWHPPEAVAMVAAPNRAAGELLSSPEPRADADHDPLSEPRPLPRMDDDSPASYAADANTDSEPPSTRTLARLVDSDEARRSRLAPQVTQLAGPPGDPAASPAEPARVVPSRPPVTQHQDRLRAEQQFQAGKRQLGAKDYRAAELAFAEASRLFPGAFEYLLYAEWARFLTLTRPGDKLLKRKDLRSLAVRVLRQNRSMAIAHYVLGQLALMDGDQAGAVTAFRLACRLDPAEAEYRRAYQALVPR